MPKEEAKGIPSRKYYGDLSKIRRDMLLDYVLQRHLARVAGDHRDLRFGNRKLGLYSWAVPKGMPGPGDRPRLAIGQPQHKASYASFQGEIPEGYGAGTVTTEDRGKALITRSDPNRIEFTLTHKSYPDRYAMVRIGGKSWLVTKPRDENSNALEDIKGNPASGTP